MTRMKQFNSSCRQSGFTLIELMITLVIIATLLAVVAPAVRDIRKKNRIETSAHSLFTSLIFTRSEALKRNSQVVLCKSNNGADCTVGSEWHEGWLVYADADSDSAPDPNEVLRIGAALENGDTLYISGTSFTDQIAYNVDGSASGLGRFVLCNEGESDEFAKEVSISLTGRPRINSGTSDCTP